MKIFIIFISLTLITKAFASSTNEEVINILDCASNSKILLCGIDGVRTDVFEEVLQDPELKDFKALWESSAHTLKAKAGFPSESVTGWNAILYGRKPSFWDLGLPSFQANSKKYNGTDNLFTLISKRYEGSKTALVGNWSTLTEIIPSEQTNHQHLPEGFISGSFDSIGFKAPYWPNTNVVDPLLEFIKEPYRFAFVYFVGTDDIAHVEGIGKEYKESLKIYLKRIAQLKSYLSPNDYLCLVSDHGRDDFSGCCGSCACLMGKTHRAFFNPSSLIARESRANLHNFF
jgi:predicted AlkP superfamily pyrophosphatase or phosphodiesterase